MNKSQGTNVTVGNGYYREFTIEERLAEEAKKLKEIKEGKVKIICKPKKSK